MVISVLEHLYTTNLMMNPRLDYDSEIVKLADC